MVGGDPILHSVAIKLINNSDELEWSMDIEVNFHISY